MRITVVIPMFNEEKKIGNCLRCLTNQTRPPDEIIVVDNNSTDHSLLVVQLYKQVRVVTEKKQGMAYARDCGFTHATGDIICQTDADSQPPTDWVQKIETILVANPQIVAVSGPIRFIEFPFSLFGSFSSLLMSYLLAWLFGHPIIYGPNKGLRAEALKKITPCVSNLLHEDFDLAQHLHLVGKVCFSPKVVMDTSARRMYETPKKFFIDYPVMIIRNLRHHPTTQSVLA